MGVFSMSTFKKVPDIPPSPLSKEYAEDSEWLDAHATELAAKYWRQWVAVLDKKVVAFGHSLGEVEATVKRDYPGRHPVVWLFTDDVYTAA